MRKGLKDSPARTVLGDRKAFCAGSLSMKVAHYLLILNMLFAEGQSLSDLRKALFQELLLLQQTGHESNPPTPQTNISPNYQGNGVHLTELSVL